MTQTPPSSLYLRLLGYVKPYWRVFALVIFAMMVAAITEPAIPALLQPLLDGGFVEKDPEIIKTIPLLLILIALLRGVATYVSQVGLTWVASQVVKDLRNALFQRLLHLPTSAFDNASSGTLLSKVTYDVNRVMLATTDALLILVRDSLTVAGLLGWMFYLNWQLSLLVFTILPLIIVIVKVASKHLRRDNLSMQDAMGDMARILEEAISGHKLVKIFRGQDYESRRFENANGRVQKYEVRTKVVSNLSIFLVQMLTAAALAVIIYIAAILSEQDQISVGGFISLFTAMGMLFAPIKRLTKVNEQIQQGLAAAQSVFELMDQVIETDAASSDKDAAALKLSGAVRLQHLSFSYPSTEHPVLRDIQLQVKPGESIALVGMSGSGKTTLANLLARFYPVPPGAVLFDGIDINDLPLRDLRDNLALVSQDVVLFNDTVAANIAYGGMAHSARSAIEAAAQAAYAMDFIEKMPQGLDTIIGERGVKLSGGQRQRLAIARALLKDAPILIFDEATSALDTQAEKQVQASLEKLQKNRTTFIIAHRLSTIEKADRILVMEQGRIVETGDHQSLLQAGGAYARLYQAQHALQADLGGAE